MKDVKTLVQEIKKGSEWDMEQLAELCKIADMSDEWEKANSENFEQIAFRAAQKLGVEIL